jgi:hypothetical protein
VAEPATLTTGSAAVTRTRLPIGVALGLALAALATVALGIVPLLITQVADAAAAGLVR